MVKILLGNLKGRTGSCFHFLVFLLLSMVVAKLASSKTCPLKILFYLDFPQGRMKLFGTIVYPKNRYLTLQFSRSGKNVMCDDYFDHLIVFSEAWWIGTKEENPEELKLDFPKEVFEGKGVECDFKGGAGAGSVSKQVVHKSGGTKYVKEESPETELNDDSSDDNKDSKDLKEVTPIRQSERTAGKTFRFAEVSSGDDSAERSPDALEKEEEEENKVKTNVSFAVAPGIESESSREGNHISEQIQAPAISVTKSKKSSESAVSVMIPKENSYNNHGSLVQSTISTLFQKVQEKKKAEEREAPRTSRKSLSSKDSGQKLQKTDSKRKIDPVEAPRRRGKVTEGKKAGTKAKEKVCEVEDDDIEEFSSSSQGTEGSDEDWDA